MHETIGSPSTRTVHAPHSASSQPILVPVRCNRWRRSAERVSPGIDSNECCFPFTERLIIDIPLILFCSFPRGFEHVFEQTHHDMPPVIRAGAAGTGPETYLRKQRFY